ncbi:hypothetical protein PoB_003183600 [Plakobranchus ocellatus]|uniref:Uncharacterized protein n=1 Tax=Plakobranchus ocellatus TaxID=259542 RepID=A0AAV4AAH5_9GAST|nr:hypothetical protein PoB_003183600 [Plakobranchus ocellatus]
MAPVVGLEPPSEWFLQISGCVCYPAWGSGKDNKASSVADLGLFCIAKPSLSLAIITSPSSTRSRALSNRCRLRKVAHDTNDPAAVSTYDNTLP